MRNLKIFAMLVLVVLAFGISAFAQVTVSGSTGANGNYTELNLAFTALNGAGTQAGNNITVNITGNTTEAASAVLNAGDWASVTIRPTVTATVQGTITTAVIKLNGADNVTIDGRIGGVGTNRDLTVRNNSTAAATAAIWLASVAAGNGATNNVIRNLEVAAGATSNTTTNTTIGIFMGGTTISLSATTGNDDDNNQFLFNRVTRARYGIATLGVSTNNNLNTVINDNIVGPTSFGADEIGKAGIYMQFDTGATVSRNTVQFVGGDLANTTSGADRCGICIGNENWSATDTTTVTSGDYTVTKNIVHDVVEERTFSANGIRLGTTRAGSATNNLVANNFIYNVRANGTSGDQLAPIGYSGGHTDRIVFNSIAMTGDVDPGASGSTSQYGAAIRVSAASSASHANLTLANNSIYLDVNSNTAATHFYAISLPSATYSFGTGFLNYNNYYINQSNTQLRTGGLSSATGASATTELQTLANWQGALTPAQDANSIQADPQYFSNTSNLHIQIGSPNINVGLPDAAVTDDIDAQARPNGAGPDIGADEFYVSPGTVQFSSATYSTTESSGSVTITVTRASGANGAISVDYATVAGGSATGGASCTAGVDYITTSGTLNWADLDIAPKTFNITICPDATFKGSETVNLALSNPTGGATLGTPNTAVLTIANSTTFGAAVNVGTAETITSLTNPGGLFEQINNGVLTSNLVVNITSDLTAETGAVALNQFAGGFTVTIQPSGGAARLVSGGSATVLLNFNGADGVIINGLNTGGNSLVIRNTAAGTGTAVQFINDASNNTVTNTTLEGGGTGAVLNIGTGTTTGNDNITITNNTIRDRSDATSAPFNSINLIGSSAAVSNSNTLINNNQIFNFTQAGIVVGTSDGVTFTNNNIYQTASRTSSLFGIALNSATGTNVFSQNQIHDLTTTLNTTGIALNDARGTTVSRNRVYNFPSTSGSTGVLTGIQFTGSSGNPASVTLVNNMISIIPAFTNAQNIFGIRDFGFSGNTYVAYYNSVLIGGTGSGTSNTWTCQRGFAAPTTFTQINNLCFNNRTGGTGNHFAMGDESQGTGTFTANYNIYVGTGATAANFFDLSTSSTATPVSFATWQAGTPTRDANSQSSNPGGNYTVANIYTSTTDLHLIYTATNPALGTGDGAATGVTTDYDNDPRPASNPDIGADELVQAVAGALPAGTYYNAALVSGNFLGGNVTINGTLTLGSSSTYNGNGNTLTIGCNASISGAGVFNYFVNTVIRKDFCAPGSFTFPVGGTMVPLRAAGINPWTPVTANITALGINPSSLSVSTTDNFLTGSNTSNSASRFWTLTETGDLTADLSFTYGDADVVGNEALYKVLKREGGVTRQSLSSTNNPATNTASISGVTNFSDWAVGNLVAVAANVNIAGRVVRADGATGISRAQVVLSGGNLSQPVTVLTNPFGYYSFEGLEVGQTYILTVGAKQYTFSSPSIVISPDDNVQNADFVANPLE